MGVRNGLQVNWPYAFSFLFLICRSPKKCALPRSIQQQSYCAVKALCAASPAVFIILLFHSSSFFALKQRKKQRKFKANSMAPPVLPGKRTDWQ